MIRFGCSGLITIFSHANNAIAIYTTVIIAMIPQKARRPNDRQQKPRRTNTIIIKGMPSQAYLGASADVCPVLLLQVPAVPLVATVATVVLLTFSKNNWPQHLPRPCPFTR